MTSQKFTTAKEHILDERRQALEYSKNRLSKTIKTQCCKHISNNIRVTYNLRTNNISLDVTGLSVYGFMVYPAKKYKLIIECEKCGHIQVI